MPVAIGVSAAVAAGIIFAVSQVDMHKILKAAEKKVMKVVEAPKPIQPPPPPPPPPPREVKKIVQPQQQPEIAPPPPANIAAVDDPGANAPAVGTLGATGPATASPVNLPPAPAKPAIQQVGVVCSNASPPDGNRMLRELKLNEISGEVTLRITIDGAGNVTDSAVVSSNTQPARVADRYLQRHSSRYKCQASGSTIIAEQTFVFKFE
jgi:protein TonB